MPMIPNGCHETRLLLTHRKSEVCDEMLVARSDVHAGGDPGDGGVVDSEGGTHLANSTIYWVPEVP